MMGYTPFRGLYGGFVFLVCDRLCRRGCPGRVINGERAASTKTCVCAVVSVASTGGRAHFKGREEQFADCWSRTPCRNWGRYPRMDSTLRLWAERGAGEEALIDEKLSKCRWNCEPVCIRSVGTLTLSSTIDVKATHDQLGRPNR